MKIVKMCVVCGGIKQPEEFYKDSRMKAGLSSECKECKRTRALAYRKGEHEPRGKKKSKHGIDDSKAIRKINNASSNMRITFGIDQKAYDEQLKAQNGVCAICGENPESSRRLSIDHCHTSGVLRGILCHSCNVGLGFFSDDVEKLKKAITYLQGNGCWQKSHAENGRVS